MKRIVIVGPGRPYDLVAVCLIVALSVVLSWSRVDSPVLWVLAFFSVYFAPGYALTSFIFPGNKVLLFDSLLIRREPKARGISVFERLALSFALSFAIGAFSGIILLDLSDFNSTSVWVELLAITIGASLLAYFARSRLSTTDQFHLVLTGWWGGQKLSKAEKAIVVVIVMGVLSAAIILAYGALNRSEREPYTDFFITGPGGELSQLPSALGVSKNGTILINVINHEGKANIYNLTLGLSNDSSFDKYSALELNNSIMLNPKEGYLVQISLQNGRSVEYNFTFSIESQGDYRLYFKLQNSDKMEELWIWLHVTGTS